MRAAEGKGPRWRRRQPRSVRRVGGCRARALGGRPPPRAAGQSGATRRAVVGPVPQARTEPRRQPSAPSLLCNRCGCRSAGYIKGRSRAGRGEVVARRPAKGQRQPLPGAARVVAWPLPSSSARSTVWGRGPAAAPASRHRGAGQPGGQSSSAGRREGQSRAAQPSPVPASPRRCLLQPTPPTQPGCRPALKRVFSPLGVLCPGAVWRKPCHRQPGSGGPLAVRGCRAVRGVWSGVLGAGQSWRRRSSLPVLQPGLGAERVGAVLVAPLVKR